MFSARNNAAGRRTRTRLRSRRAHPKGLADKLFKVWLQEGDEVWLLIHIEVQGQAQAIFPQRMFVYNSRTFDRYNRAVVSLAVLADDQPAGLEITLSTGAAAAAPALTSCRSSCWTTAARSRAWSATKTHSPRWSGSSACAGDTRGHGRA